MWKDEAWSILVGGRDRFNVTTVGQSAATINPNISGLKTINVYFPLM